MTTKKKILYDGRTIGLIYVSPHPEYAGHLIGTIVPIARKGKWTDNTASLVFERPLHDIFPDNESVETIAKQLTGQAQIEWWKVAIVDDEIVN